MIGLILGLVGISLFIAMFFLSYNNNEDKWIALDIIWVLLMITGIFYTGINSPIGDNETQIQTEQKELNNNYEVIFENDDIIIIKKK